MSSQPTEPSGPSDPTPNGSDSFSSAAPASYPDVTAAGHGQAPASGQAPTYVQQSPWGGPPVTGQPPLGQPPVYGQPGPQTPRAGRGGDSPRKAAAKRTMLFGVLWFVAGIIVSVVTIAMGTHGVIFWGLSLYGVIQIVRGAIAYGRA